MDDFAYARAARDGGGHCRPGQSRHCPIAGGTELLNWLRLGIAAPARLVDI